MSGTRRSSTPAQDDGGGTGQLGRGFLRFEGIGLLRRKIGRRSAAVECGSFPTDPPEENPLRVPLPKWQSLASVAVSRVANQIVSH